MSDKGISKPTSSGPSSGTSTPLDTSATQSRRNSAGGDGTKTRGGHRVKFSVGLDDMDLESPPRKPIPDIRLGEDGGSSSKATKVDILDTDISADVTDTPQDFRSPAGSDDEEEEDIVGRSGKIYSALSAQSRAQQLASLLGSHSAPGSRRNSIDSPPLAPRVSPPPSRDGPQSHRDFPVRIDDIPLVEINGEPRRPYSIYEDSDEEDKPKEKHREDNADTNKRRQRAVSNAEAHRIVRTMTGKLHLHRPSARSDGLKSGQITPVEEQDPDHYVPRPAEYKTGILASLLKLYDQQESGPSSRSRPSSAFGRFHHSRHSTADSASLLPASTPNSSPPSSGYNTPRSKPPKWYDQKSPRQSTTSLAGLLNASTMMATPAASSNAGGKPTRPGMSGRSHSGGVLSAMGQKIKPSRHEDEIRITVHIAEVLSRQRFLLKLIRALMLYGAPTHRLEEYARSTARVLQIEGQFLYIPGCMVISLDDSSTHTAEVKIVKVAQGVDLGRLKDTHNVMKAVLHDKMGVEEATKDLDEIMKRGPRWNKLTLIIAYGFASAFVGPFAFSARPIDMPICFALGILLGILQLVVAPASELYANVFEITATVLTSFLARAFGSIYSKTSGEPYFCFSAIAQSSIALILPGYVILCGSLELQSKSLVAGSVRMVYAIIFSLMLGFGVTIGTTLYGLMDSNATTSYTCPSLSGWSSNAYVSHFPFVPLFTICLIIINQGKWTQAPMMVFIAFAGWQVNYWSSLRFSSNVQVADALGAFAIGVMGNLYSRLRHGVAAATILPAIYVTVPSGLAASGSLLAGIQSAEQLTSNNSTSSTVVSNGTQGFADAESSSYSSYTSGSSTVYNIGYGMVQVAIGISVGLFLSSVFIYPFGKRRSGLFTF